MLVTCFLFSSILRASPGRQQQYIDSRAVSGSRQLGRRGEDNILAVFLYRTLTMTVTTNVNQFRFSVIYSGRVLQRQQILSAV
jgi:hypothetical protein